MTNFPIWAGWMGQNSSVPVRTFKPLRLIVQLWPKRVQLSLPMAIGLKASTLLTNATSQESKRDPIPTPTPQPCLKHAGITIFGKD
jgi:hypothetical protein